MTSGGPDQPAEAQRAAGTNQPPVQRPVASQLLTSAVDDATRERLVYTVGGRQSVLVELSLSAGAPTADLRDQFRDVFHGAFAPGPEQPPDPMPISANYMRCLLTPDEVTKLADQDTARPTATPPLSRTIYRIWPDYVVRAHIDRSATTIKADAATRTYGTAGTGVVWAVIDSGIDKDHPHFAGGTLTDDSVAHLHRSPPGPAPAGGTVPDDPSTALTDPVGHGTHVAGIIAGAAPADQAAILIAANQPSSGDLPSWVKRT